MGKKTSVNKVGIIKLSKKINKKINNSISESLLQDCIKIIIEQMGLMILCGQNINIENFGIIYVSFTKDKKINFLNKEIKNIPQQKTIKFKTHNNLLQIIKKTIK